MTSSIPPHGRRKFLKSAAAGAAGFIGDPNSEAAGAPHHDHDQDHEHQAVPSDVALRVKALESLLVEKGMVDPAALDAVVDTYEHKIGPRNGARVVARAWIDPAYKKRLLTDGAAAILELGYGGAQGEYMVVVENSRRFTTWSSARSARAIRGPRSVFRRPGTSRRAIDRAR